ncbi:hypothetical protein NVP1193O_035 [Vibrio phage 1.193.O._10N.286.52.C6]|nr:hypothetical protein NVP1193O_035 [Vibrio phage 1.193.O._10N.286.52.C6]
MKLTIHHLPVVGSLDEIEELLHSPDIFDFLNGNVMFPVLTKSGIHKKASLDILRTLKVDEASHYEI